MDRGPTRRRNRRRSSNEPLRERVVYEAFFSVTGEKRGRTQALGDLAWRSFEAFNREHEGGEPSLDREMITPRAHSEADASRLVFRAGW